MSNRLRELIAARDAAPSGVLTPALNLRDWMENHAEEFADLWGAAEPFAKIVAESDGRIPTEKLSLADWHAVAKAFAKLKEQP
jgi:hypothetical protein